MTFQLVDFVFGQPVSFRSLQKAFEGFRMLWKILADSRWLQKLLAGAEMDSKLDVLYQNDRCYFEMARAIWSRARLSEMAHSISTWRTF